MGTVLLQKHGASLSLDLGCGCIRSLILGGVELISHPAPLFTLRLRGEDGTVREVTAFDASSAAVSDTSAVYSYPDENVNVHVGVKGFSETNRLAEFSVRVENNSGFYACEWLIFPAVALPKLTANGGVGEALLPYNEGAVIRDINQKPNETPEYPSTGYFFMFPNMICSQFMAYSVGNNGLYIGAHDPGRAPKGIDILPSDTGTTAFLRLFCGCDTGSDFAPDYPIVFDVYEGSWHAAADIYRGWFEEHLPLGIRKVRENPDLPAWYDDMPLIVTYPVRGLHDMDEMTPNALFPYRNALPYIDEIASTVGCRILVLLMHWEGTAPWAPPFVWPPFGGVDAFSDFADTLHAAGHLIGVYCSGFGFTLQSNLIPSYNNEKRFADEHLADAMCASPTNTPEISRICTGQRRGYDICPASKHGRALLDEAYSPLFDSDIDYAQILDQNHGGGQYFCCSRDHGHPRTPGLWMTKEMQELLSDWHEKAPDKLFGCESAAAEPFFPRLLFSDNRFELNWSAGEPVPLFAYLYHEYLHNFMGNQVSCHLANDRDTLRYRMAYAFAAGDCLSLVLRPDGEFYPEWGCRDENAAPDRKLTLTFAANLRRLFENVAAPFLRYGRMIRPIPVICETVAFTKKRGGEFHAPVVLTTAFECDGRSVQLLINHTDADRTVNVGTKQIIVPALCGTILERKDAI